MQPRYRPHTFSGSHSNVSDKPQLLQVLALTKQQVKLLDAMDGGVRRINAAEAVLMARGREYEWGGSNHRVRWMRACKPDPKFEHCYRTDEAPVIQPSIDWLNSRYVVGA